LKRIIVTGGSGFIGKHLVKRVLSCNPSSILVIGNRVDKYFEDEILLRDTPLSILSADIRDRETISQVFKEERADTCVHLAAKISVADSIKSPDETMDINAKGTLNVLEASYESQVKNFVFASSAAVYGDVKELPISENQELEPLSPYGKSKMLAEQYVSSFQKQKKIKNTICLRIFNVYGSGQSSEVDVITRFAKRLSKGLPPEIHGDGKNTRDFISVDDVTEAILLSVRAMEEPKSNYNNNLNLPPVFNVGTGTPTSIKDLAKKMITISGLKVDPINKKGNQDSGVILHSYADMTKAKRALHFVARKDLEEGLREIIEQMPESKGLA
jgi:UDP-glucose 4-epimerase